MPNFIGKQVNLQIFQEVKSLENKGEIGRWDNFTVILRLDRRNQQNPWNWDEQDKCDEEKSLKLFF